MFHVKQQSPNVSRETTAVADSEKLRELFIVSRETTQRLAIYADLLLRWNEKINLISRDSETQLWSRHIADSLQLIELIPGNVKHALDIGSGAGFPGLVVAIATGISFHLVEADKRKAAFLREAARQTGAPVTISALRVEAVEATAPLITARALAPLTSLLDMAVPHLDPAGVCLFPKGVDVDRELTDARVLWNMRVERHPSRIDPHGCILRISEVSRV